MNTAPAMPKSPAESAFLAELLAETLALADKIAGAIDAARNERFEESLNPIRLAEIAADADMRAGVGKAMDREIARQMLERRASVAAKCPVASVKRPAPVGNLKPAPFALTPAVVAKAIGLPVAAKGLVDIPIAPVMLVPRQAREDRRPRSSEDPTRPTTWSDQAEAANDVAGSIQPIPSEPRLGSRAPALLDEAQHCHSLTSADEHTEDAGAQQITSRSRHPVQKSGHDVDGARGGVSRSMPVPEASPPTSLADQVAAECAEIATRWHVARKFGGGVGKLLALPDVAFDQDAHESELARIERRPPIRISNQAERRAAERAREDAKAARIAQFKASWAKVCARTAEEAGE